MHNTFLVTICQFKTPTYNLELEANVRIGHSSLSDFLFFEKLRTVYDVLAFIEKKTQKTSTLFFVFFETRICLTSSVLFKSVCHLISRATVSISIIVLISTSLRK